MRVLVQKPHFDVEAFKPGTPINVTFPRIAYERFKIQKDCLVLSVDKDILFVTYVEKDAEGDIDTHKRSISSEDVQKGEAKIKFLVEEKENMKNEEI